MGSRKGVRKQIRVLVGKQRGELSKGNDAEIFFKALVGKRKYIGGVK